MKIDLNNTVLKNRYTLLVTVIVCYILLVVIEGVVTDRQTPSYDFENPFFDLNLNNIEEFQSR
jgi:hypothetical protein